MARSQDNETPREDLLAEFLIDELNKGEKRKIAYNLSIDDAPTKVKYWIPTGCPPLDIIISNRRDGGLPCGKMILCEGLESSGKSLLVAHAIASIQKMGGIAVFIDSESAVSPEFLSAIGVDLTKIVYVQTQDMVVAFSTIEKIIKAVIEKNVKKPVLVAMDSITALTLPVYLEQGTEAAGYEGAKNASYLSGMLKKLATEFGNENICFLYTSQMRTKMGAMPNEYGFTSTGGLAPVFYASVRLRLKRKGLLGDRAKPEGILTQVETIKNRIGPERRTVTIPIRYDRGIDYYDSVVRDAVDLGIIEGKAWKCYKANDGREIKYQSNFAPLIEGNVIEEIIDKIFEKRQFKYRTGEITTEDTGVVEIGEME